MEIKIKNIQMKKLFLFIAIQFFIGGFLLAQDKLLIRTNEKGIYLEHTVSPKESFYSVGRLYNVAPKDIAAFNSLDLNNGLNIGQHLHIPLGSQNFSQTVSKGTPVYYQVAEKEGLYRVSINSNKVPLESLRKWNNLSGDNISTGSYLIVGYLNSDEISKATVSAPVVEKPAPVPNPEIKKEKPAEVKTVPIEEKPVEVKTVVIEKTPEKPVIKKVEEPRQATVASSTNGYGYFKAYFDQQVKTFPLKKEATVTSGIFKTASGWQDGKYYMLIDNVEPGMIVKITNPSNGKVLFAKVLGQMSGIRQNQGLEIRMSNSAASVLDIQDTDKFIVQVNY